MEEFPSIKVKIGEEKATVKKMKLGGKDIPLCHKCLKSVLLSATLTNFDFISISLDFEDIK